MWMPRPARHSDIIKMCVDLGMQKPISGIQGFLTNRGRFVPRGIAAQIAIKSKQIERLSHPPFLYTEDLW